jgi:hypothetical protein
MSTSKLADIQAMHQNCLTTVCVVKYSLQHETVLCSVIIYKTEVEQHSRSQIIQQFQQECV